MAALCAGPKAFDPVIRLTLSRFLKAIGVFSQQTGSECIISRALWSRQGPERYHEKMGRLLNPNLLQNRGDRMATLQGAPSGRAVLTHPGWGVPPAERVAIPVDNAEGDVFRKFAFRAGLAMLFIRVAALSELLLSWLHFNTYILYLVGPPAIVGAVLTGGLGRALRHRAAWMWLCFFGCMVLSIPFSSWMGDSARDLKGYAEYSLPLLFTIGGLAVNFREVRSTFYAIAAGGLVVIGAARFLAQESSARVDMTSTSGTIGNPNDLASHLILVLPFLLFITRWTGGGLR